ncbi:MAG: MFS transporter [Bacteroidota bacterium]|nr:MFS transporter [Bacteroidota bacterium]
MVEKIGSYRWKIVALLFFATTINYIDRQVLSLVMIDEGFKNEFNFTKAELGYIDASFKAAYALGFLLIGGLIDRFGTRIGFMFSITFWSIAAMCHGLARNFVGFAIARFGLGLGESGHFPGAVKTVSEWFPKKERSFATGLFNSGANVGAIAAPLLVPIITINYGWRWAFVLTGMLGFVWLIFWIITYQKPENSKKLSQRELNYIKSDEQEIQKSIPWLKLLTFRQTWALICGKFFCDPIWWFYLTWLPMFFNENTNLDRQLDLKTVGIPFLIIYVISDLGSIAGGWFSSFLMQKGWSNNRARKTTMLICAICVVPIIFVSYTHNFWVAIGLIALATAAHQANSANVYTLASDMFPKHAIASVTGIGGMFGAVGGVLLAAVAGVVIQNSGYASMFIIGGSAYLVSLGFIHILAPKLEPVILD